MISWVDNHMCVYIYIITYLYIIYTWLYTHDIIGYVKYHPPLAYEPIHFGGASYYEGFSLAEISGTNNYQN